MIRVWALLALAVLSAYPAPPGRVPDINEACDATTVVRATSSGAVGGVMTPRGLAFVGNPFAAPPLANRRFMPPASPPAWIDTVPAIVPGDSCGTSEDCLTLNIYAPHDASPAHPRPVMVWIYGGRSSWKPTTSMTSSTMAEQQQVIIVAANYRLGALGFLAHLALAGPG